MGRGGARVVMGGVRGRVAGVGIVSRGGIAVAWPGQLLQHCCARGNIAGSLHWLVARRIGHRLGSVTHCPVGVGEGDASICKNS